MTNDKIHFTKEKETMLMTLSSRAIQSQWKNPILRDPLFPERDSAYHMIGAQLDDLRWMDDVPRDRRGCFLPRECCTT